MRLRTLALLLVGVLVGCASPQPTHRCIYLTGRFTAPLNKDGLAAQLRAKGYVVADKMAPGVDTVILGHPPINETQDGFTPLHELADYKLAKDMGAELVPLETARSVFGL